MPARVRSRPPSTSATQPAGRFADAHGPQQRPGDVAHHVMQECIGGDLDLDVIAVAANGDADSTRRTGVGDWHSAERNAEKSCSPISALRGLVHGVDVERPVDPAGARALERRPRSPIQDAVAVGARQRAECARGSRPALRRAQSTRVVSAASAIRRAPRPARDRDASVSKCATCTTACTPASVRPAAVSRSRGPRRRESARSNFTLHRSGHATAHCQPQ